MGMPVHALCGLVLLCVPALGFAQGTDANVDRSATVRSAQEAMRADGSRPGDEQLSCEAIGEEMAGLFGAMNPELDTLFTAAERANAETQRTQQMLAARSAIEGQRANAAMQATAGAAAGVIDQHADKIPRMNRLTQLWEAKQCKPPAGGMADDDD